MVDESAAFVAALREVVWEQRIAGFGVVLLVDAVDARVAQTGPALRACEVCAARLRGTFRCHDTQPSRWRQILEVSLLDGRDHASANVALVTDPVAGFSPPRAPEVSRQNTSW